HVPRGMAVAGPGRNCAEGRLALARSVRLRLAAGQALPHRLELPVVPRDVPALPLRPDHAARLEGVPAAHHRMDHRPRRVDANAVMDMVEIMISRVRKLLGT